MTKTYQDAVNLLTSVGKFHISLGLERMEEILQLLGNPQDELACIHVAGTNGKGSVCAIIGAVLCEEGKKVGIYSSPHIFKYTERIKILEKSTEEDVSQLSQEISDFDFSKDVFEVLELADKNGIDLTEFEILTAVMFKYFADKKVDVVVLETGLGGRFDATNVIKKNLCSVITHIDFDHTERLGNTLDKIAYEKAGIIKPNCPCIVTEGREVFYDVASSQNSMLIVTTPHYDVENLAIKGSYQQENLALALTAIENVFPKISQETIRKGLKKVKHFCRFQYIEEKNLIIDGAHNPNGINALRESLKEYFPRDRRRFIFGCLRNKDYPKMIQTLFQKGDDVWFYHFKHQNSCTFEELKDVCNVVEVKELTPTTKIDFDDGFLNVICGSFYMIEELVTLFDLKKYF
jgi:dihydrofolate synthase/folylpolyglutamate synthase